MKFEGCSLKAYKCPAGVWTIGWGNTTYADGKKVKEGDKIDQATANQLLKVTVEKFEKQVKLLIGTTLNTTLPEKAIDSLTVFAYNVGTTAFAKSTLLKTIKANKNDLTNIEKQWMRWNKASGKELAGLTRRRKAEAEMYKNAILNQYSRSEIYDSLKATGDNKVKPKVNINLK